MNVVYVYKENFASILVDLLRMELNMARIEIHLLQQKILTLTNCCGEYTTKYKEMASLNEYLQLQHKHQTNMIHQLIITNQQHTK